MYSGKYDSSLYLAKNYEDLANKMFNGKNAYGYLSQSNAELTANVHKHFLNFLIVILHTYPRHQDLWASFLVLQKNLKLQCKVKYLKLKKT
jgi:hypothetical protein